MTDESSVPLRGEVTERARHTPGPWGQVPGGDSRIEVAASRRLIASVGVVPYWGKFTAEDEANAALIRSAPDLLVALKAVLPYLGDIISASTDDFITSPAAQMTFDKARAAIAKAEPS